MVDREVGRRVRRRLREAGISQAEAAAWCGVTGSAISQLVNGRRGLSPLRLVRLARLLGLDVRELFRDEVVPAPAVEAQPEPAP